MNRFDEMLDSDFIRMIGTMPTPKNPHQPMVLNLPNSTQDIHPERDDFARDSEATSV